MLKREEGWQYDGSLDDMWAKEIDETGQMTLGEPPNLWHIYLHLQIHEHGYGNGSKDSASRLEGGSAGRSNGPRKIFDYDFTHCAKHLQRQ